ncbi:MAG: hypothetical protein SH848_13950, partial [Saprospiraceae bacterium]|nr:hypothetical protein [Saprospiraceae bacterium]MDZ4705032.1 hypothetical protein [Saprospiraceae bacterium]
EYKRICPENSVDRAFSQHGLLQFLHDLGIVINFRNLKNFDTPIWSPALRICPLKMATTTSTPPGSSVARL